MFLPARSGAFCVDPLGSEQAYGEEAEKPFERACEELLDGECEVYRRFGALRIVETRYVHGAGSPATLVVHLTKFAGTEGAYAMFTLRVVGDGDPAAEGAPAPLSSGAAAALGQNNAYVWRGPYLAEITYTDETAGTVRALAAAAAQAVKPLAESIGDALPGERVLPSAAAQLPDASRLPLGVRFHTTDLFGIEGIGGGAIGYYKEANKRYRAVVIERREAEGVKDLLRTIAAAKLPISERKPDNGMFRIMVSPPGELPTEWVLTRAGNRVIGIGDEVRVLRDTMSSEERAAVSLSIDEKRAKLKTWTTPQ